MEIDFNVVSCFFITVFMMFRKDLDCIISNMYFLSLQYFAAYYSIHYTITVFVLILEMTSSQVF